MKGNYMKNSTNNEIRNALKILGVIGEVKLTTVTIDRIAVYVNGEYFGIWDTEKKTFVD